MTDLLSQLPAELFPTRYRALCHGISAASGKLGSVVAQVFLAYINYGNGINYNHIQKWLPYSLLMFVSLPSLPHTTPPYSLPPPKPQLPTIPSPQNPPIHQFNNSRIQADHLYS
jgi:hypothetical protein